MLAVPRAEELGGGLVEGAHAGYQVGDGALHSTTALGGVQPGEYEAEHDSDVLP